MTCSMFQFLSKMDKCGKDATGVKLSKYLRTGRDINKIDIKYSRTILHYACLYNNYKVVKILLRKNADLNIQDKFNKTPLHYCYKNSTLTNLILSRSSPDITLKDCNNNTVLDYAIYHSSPSMIHILKYHNRYNNLGSITSYKHQDILRNINFINIKKYQANDVIIKLLECQPQANRLNYQPNDILKLFELGDIKLVRYLTNNYHSIKDDDDNTFLHSLFSNTPKVIRDTLRLLTDNEITYDIFATNKLHINPLQMLLKDSNLEKIKVILEFDSNVYQKDRYGKCLLHYAASSNINAMMIISEKYPDKNIVDDFSNNALGLALFSYKFDIAEYLILSGCKSFNELDSLYALLHLLQLPEICNNDRYQETMILLIELFKNEFSINDLIALSTTRNAIINSNITVEFLTKMKECDDIENTIPFDEIIISLTRTLIDIDNIPEEKVINYYTTLISYGANLCQSIQLNERESCSLLSIFFKVQNFNLILKIIKLIDRSEISNDRTILHSLIKEVSSLDEVQTQNFRAVANYLIEYEPQLLETKDVEGRTPIFYCRSAVSLQYLIAKGAQLTYDNKSQFCIEYMFNNFNEDDQLRLDDYIFRSMIPLTETQLTEILRIELNSISLSNIKIFKMLKYNIHKISNELLKYQYIFIMKEIMYTDISKKLLISNINSSSYDIEREFYIYKLITKAPYPNYRLSKMGFLALLNSSNHLNTTTFLENYTMNIDEEQLLSNIDFLKQYIRNPKYKNEEQNECSICLTNLTTLNTHCGHYCCLSCMIKWKKNCTSFTCPICRAFL